MLRAIYGCIESALQWYVLYKTTLENEGYELNSYDRCIANKMIDGRKCTICWYVDDNKASDVDEKVLEELLETIEKHVGDLKSQEGGNMYSWVCT